jgi:hypothetical protein
MNEDLPLDILRNEPSAVIDPAAIAEDGESHLEEEAQVTEELARPHSPLTQRRPTSSSESPEQLNEVENMVFWINNSRRFDDVFPRQSYYKWHGPGYWIRCPGKDGKNGKIGLAQMLCLPFLTHPFCRCTIILVIQAKQIDERAGGQNPERALK